MGNSLKSYPFTILSSLASTIFFCLSINSKHDYFLEGGFACLAVVALFYAIETYSSSIILRLLGLVIGGSFYYFYIRKQLANHSYPDLSFVRYAIFLLLAHLLAALSGYKKYDIWAFNKSLFINIIITFLYTMTLFVGLGIALGGISALFDIKIESEVWGYIFVTSNVFLSTLLFVSNPLETNEQVYPKFLKNFASYILIPLTSIYTIILLTYGFQILITKEVPKGWVSLMVFSNAILGILSFLLLYPLRKTTQWINKFTNVYFWILLPLIVLLAMAIWIRIDQYGLTFGRTMIIALGIWLLGITLYYIISKKDLIVVVPASLFVVVLWHTFGPLNGAILSNWQQKKSLEKHLALLSKGKLKDKEIDRLNASIDFFQLKIQAF